MKSYSIAEVEHTLKLLGIEVGDTLLVQTALMDLGVIRGEPVAKIPEAMYNAIRRRIGAEGTVCAQSFTFGSCRGEVFDREQTPSSTGAFAEYLRGLKATQRSAHPIQSLVANGPKAGYICDLDTPSGYASDGPYGRLLAHDAKLLLIGRSNVDTAALAHYAEEQARVPYRQWKTFIVPYREGARLRQRTYQMFVRNLALDPQLDLRQVGVLLESHGVIQCRPLGAGDVRVANARKVVETLQGLLQSNPFCLIEGNPSHFG